MSWKRWSLWMCLTQWLACRMWREAKKWPEFWKSSRSSASRIWTTSPANLRAPFLSKSCSWSLKWPNRFVCVFLFFCFCFCFCFALTCKIAFLSFAFVEFGLVTSNTSVDLFSFSLVRTHTRACRVTRALLSNDSSSAWLTTEWTAALPSRLRANKRPLWSLSSLSLSLSPQITTRFWHDEANK